jgi:dolichol-phosphate mannosyltransferase
MMIGALRFVAACSFGALANIVFARALLQGGVEWYLAGFAGIVLGSVWNLSVSSMVTWGMRSRRQEAETGKPIMVSDIEVSH